MPCKHIQLTVSVATHDFEVSLCTKGIQHAHADLHGTLGIGTVISWPPCPFHLKFAHHYTKRILHFLFLQQIQDQTWGAANS
jgi:hypothetical protein